MEKYVLGVDGGSSKTQYALFDSSGNLAGMVRGGATNPDHYDDGYEIVRKEFEKNIGGLLDQCGLNADDIGFAVFGISGADFKEDFENFRRIIGSTKIKGFKVYNDAFLGIKAGSEKGYGICSINGTGTCCAGIDRTGRYLQIGGVGYCFGDEAGASFIGEMAVRSVYDSFYRCGKKTLMTDMLFRELGITDIGEFVEAVYEKMTPGSVKIAEQARCVFLAANEGDEAAGDILEHVGREAAKSVAGAIQDLDFEGCSEIDVIMIGSVYTKGENPRLIKAFMEEVTLRTCIKTKFILLKQPPVAGAVLWALEELNGSVDAGTRTRVLNALSVL